MEQSCKKCGVRDGLNFTVSDSTWKSVVPLELRKKVICLACFDILAAEREVDYHHSLSGLYFAGRRASFEFGVVASARCSES
jgi:uncharacterized protein (AIM24 family)